VVYQVSRHGHVIGADFRYVFDGGTILINSRWSSNVPRGDGVLFKGDGAKPIKVSVPERFHVQLSQIARNDFKVLMKLRACGDDIDWMLHELEEFV